MPLYTVEVVTEVVVYAKDRREAEQYAEFDAMDNLFGEDFSYCAYPYSGLPEGWTDDLIPFGDDHGDMSIAELLEIETKVPDSYPGLSTENPRDVLREAVKQAKDELKTLWGRND